MSSHMDLESAWSHKFVAANITDVRSLSWMSSLVVSKVALGGEAHIAVSKVTFERLLTIVDPHVSE